MALIFGLAAVTVIVAPVVLVIGFACFKVRMAAAKAAPVFGQMANIRLIDMHATHSTSNARGAM